MAETVGVIVPVHNGAAFLNEALASVAAQRRQPDRVVVVDDGSTDESSVIASRWSGVLPLEVVSLADNQGLWAARNVGIETAGTDLIALLDADDVWLPDHLSVCLDTWRRAGGIVTARGLRWAPGSAIASQDTALRRPVPRPGAQRRRLVYENWVFIATVFSTTDWHAAGRFRAMGACEDWDLWLRMVRTGSRVTVTGTPTVLYRVRLDSMSAGDRLLEWQIAVLERFAAEEADPRVRRHAQRALGERRAKMHLLSAFELGRAGRPLRSRRAAVRALRGSHLVRLQAAGALLAPVLVARRRSRLYGDVTWLIGR